MVLDDEEEEGLTFLQKHRIKLIVAAVVVAGAGAFFVMSPKEAGKKKPTMTMVNIMPPLPPPPPPPPPPPKEQPPEPETVKEEKFVPETPPEPVAADPEPAPMGTNVQGDGPDAFGLAKGGGGGMIGGRGTGKGGGGGSKYGLYAGQVQSRVVDALRNHKKTRAAALNVKVRIWLDATGRVTRATISGTSGKPDVDAAIRDEILTGLQLQNPPPEGMPMPIVMRLSATRPN
ncbi:MAG: energy transducer TonB [Verrucomicrobia bacterium]|nr:energy transducer TonB [Verrucomicrobiota bacterium]